MGISENSEDILEEVGGIKSCWNAELGGTQFLDGFNAIEGVNPTILQTRPYHPSHFLHPIEQ